MTVSDHGSVIQNYGSGSWSPINYGSIGSRTAGVLIRGCLGWNGIVRITGCNNLILLFLCVHSPLSVEHRTTEWQRSLSGIHSIMQCCGSMTIRGGSGSADPCLWLVDPDPDSDPDSGSGSCYLRHCPSRCQQKTNFLIMMAVLRIRIRIQIRIHRIHMFLGLPDPDPLVRGMDLDPDPALDPNPSIIMQKK